MENYQTILPVFNGSIVTLWLARPEVHNALNEFMIREISSFFLKIDEKEEIRVVIIRGQGKSFCSGADLQWMKNAFGLNWEGNLSESKELSDMFGIIFNSSKVVIAAVHGSVFGGGIGLVAVCDLAYTLGDSKFSLSETKIGMAAASITPYLLLKMQPGVLKELIFSAKNFNGMEAENIGLVNQSFISEEELELYLKEIIAKMLANGRKAITASKQLINKLTTASIEKELEQVTVLLARIRVSPEAQEGFSAFLEKRNPNW
jgi:methylglutaconyl-CoA hydratase